MGRWSPRFSPPLSTDPGPKSPNRAVRRVTRRRQVPRVHRGRSEMAQAGAMPVWAGSGSNGSDVEPRAPALGGATWPECRTHSSNIDTAVSTRVSLAPLGLTHRRHLLGSGHSPTRGRAVGKSARRRPRRRAVASVASVNRSGSRATCQSIERGPAARAARVRAERATDQSWPRTGSRRGDHNET
jgi:hypothetical protein